MNNRIKSALSKINFYIGRNPKIEKRRNWRDFIPKPYEAGLTITADFELAWSWRYSKQFSNPLNEAQKKAQIERHNVPKIINLCENYDIPITWATVGHLFLDSCKRVNNMAHPKIIQQKNYEGKYWDFKSQDWFEYDPCSNVKDAPEWYAPDLIKKIIDSKIPHEIGCHTFSHVDCRDEVCPPKVFESEIKACIIEAKKHNINLTSFVHPGHQIGNLAKLESLGFTSFQTDLGNLLGYPKKHSNNLWELSRSFEFNYRKEWSIKYQIFRYKKIIDRAIKNHSVCNFWFHPSFDPIFVSEILPSVFQHIQSNNRKIYPLTVSDYLNKIEHINLLINEN